MQELYSNVQRAGGEPGDNPLARAGEISMEGYMEKLPMGRRRASFIKKWKKRYFRSKQGNLFYYEVGGREGAWLARRKPRNLQKRRTAPCECSF